MELVFNREYVRFGDITVTKNLGQEDDQYVLKRGGTEVNLSGDAESYLRKVFDRIDLVTRGLDTHASLEKILRRLDTMATRSQIFAPTELFRFKAITWVKGQDANGNDLAFFNHNSAEDGDLRPDLIECAEQSRHRPINRLDPARIMTYRLDTFDESTVRIQQVFETILSVLHNSTGKSWSVLGNHNEYVVFVESEYVIQIFEEIFTPEVANILKEEIAAYANGIPTIQKSHLGSKIVAICLLAAGEADTTCNEILDLSGLPVFDEDHELGDNDGCFLVVNAIKMWTICRAFGRKMAMTSGMQVRIPSIIAKGIIALEQPWLPEGWYTKGLTLRERIGAFKAVDKTQDSQIYVPQQLRIGDIIILDTTSAHNDARTISISAQMAAYADNEFRNWWEDQAIESILSVTHNGLSGSPIFNACARTNPHILMESGAWNTFQDTVMGRILSSEMVGRNWKYEREPEEAKLKKLPARSGRKIRQIQGSSERGYIRAIQKPGEYVMAMGSSMLRSEPDEDGDYMVIVTSPTARNFTWEGKKVNIGDRIHIWRCPILPHEGVALSCKIGNIWTKRKHLRWLGEETIAELTALGFEPENPAHFQVGHAIYMAPRLMLGLDGDFDGDRVMATASLVNEFEKFIGKEWRPPFIIPSETPEMNPTRIPGSYSWLSKQDRKRLAALSQSLITDWPARRWADLFDNPPSRVYDEDGKEVTEPHVLMIDGEAVDIYDLAEIKQNDQKRFARIKKVVMDRCVKIIRAQIQGKKHPVDIGDAKYVMEAPEIGYSVDVARALEAELSANGGPYIFREDGYATIHPRIRELVSELENVGREPVKQIYRAIMAQFEELRTMYENDAYMRYVLSRDGSNLAESKIAYNGKYQKEMRGKRYAKLIRTLSDEQLSKISGGDIAWIGNKIEFRVHGTRRALAEVPFVPKVALMLLKARMGEVEIAGKQHTCFWQENNDGSFTLTLPNGNQFRAEKGTVKFMTVQHHHERISQAEGIIRKEIQSFAKKFIEQEKLSLPTELSIVFEDTESWMVTVVEASLLVWLSQINLANPASTQKNQNYWTFAANIASPSTLELMLSGYPEPVEGGLKIVHSALDAVS